MPKYSWNVGSKRAFIECQLKAAWPNPMSLFAPAWFETSSSRPKAKIPISSFGNTVVQKRRVDQICILRLRDAPCSWVFRISTSEDSSSGGNLRQIHRQAILRTGHPQHS